MKKLIQSSTLAGIFAICCLLLNSCSYYEVKSFESSNKPEMIEQIKIARDSQRYVILHASNTIYALKNMDFDTTIQTVGGVLDTVDANHQFYLKHQDSKSKNMSYRPLRQKQAGVVNETHLYTTQAIDSLHGSNVRISVDSIANVKVLDRNKDLSTTVSVLIPSLIILSIIILGIAAPATGFGF